MTTNTSAAALSSWKEIAVYLGKGLRTVQRWEHELALPVHRPVAHNQRIVIAAPAELNAWIFQQRMLNTNAEQVRADCRAQRAKLVALRAELVRQREVVRHAVDSLRSCIQRQE